MFTKYRELGFSLIPIEPKEKRPAKSLGYNWQKYCERLPTEEECELWESQGHKGFGLCLGPASNLIGIDIDTDDKNVLSACPLSPVIKRGRKGETRFFRFDPEVQSCKVAGIIDVLALGKQTLLPPTIHPETENPYIWLTPDTLDNYDIKYLPVFTASHLAELRSKLELSEDFKSAVGVEISGGPWNNSDPTRNCPHGSHDRLKVIVTAMISRGCSPDEVVRELLRYDNENHRPTGYFSDKTRPDSQADPVTNALFFYASNVKTFNRRLIGRGEMPSVPMVSGSEIIEIDVPDKIAEAWKPVPWPEPKGGIKMIRELMRKASFRDIPALSMGGAIALGSVVVANKFKLMGSWSNTYVLNIAETGNGKNTPYKVIKRFLSPDNGLDHLLGNGGYQSSPAILKDLMSKRERLDLIDECSSLFETIKGGGVFQTTMLDVLNGLWSDSGTQFIGPEAMGRERINVWHPCVSALFSTTPTGLSGSVTKEFMSKGFLPRCLIFNESTYGEYRDDPVFDEELFEKIVELLNKIQSVDEVQSKKKNLIANMPSPAEIRITAKAEKMLKAYWREQSEETAKDRAEFEKEFTTRRAEQVSKLALIHGSLNKFIVDEEDVQWAISILDAVWHNSMPLLPRLSAENIQEKNMMRILETIRKHGSINHSTLIGKTRFLKTNERHELLTSLENEGKIRSFTAENRAKVWKIV